MDSFFSGSSNQQYFGYSGQEQRYQQQSTQQNRSFSPVPVNRYPGSSSALYGTQSPSNCRNLSPAFDRSNNSLLFPSTLTNSICTSSDQSLNSGNLFNFPLRSNNINNRSSPSHKSKSYTQDQPSNSAGRTSNYSFNQNRSFPQRISPNQQPPVYSYTTGNFTSFNQQANNTKSRNWQNQNSSSGFSGSKPKKMNSVAKQPDDLDPQRPCRILKRGDNLPMNIDNNVGVADNRNNVALGSFANQDGSMSINSSGNAVCGTTVNKENCGSEDNKLGEEAKGQDSSQSNNGDQNKTALSTVGEIARFHGLNIEYRLIKEMGPPHAPTFTVTLNLGGEHYEGQGSSIKRAQTAAATEALEKTTLSRPPPRTKNISRRPFAPSK